MRMWKVNPKLMCNKHLLGEHVEMHMFVGSILKGNKIVGFLKKELVEVHNIKSRHTQLANEMEVRGMNHHSKLKPFKEWNAGVVDSNKNLLELSKRCPSCRERIALVEEKV